MLWGPRDPIFPTRYLDDLAERMPQADIHRFEGAGHMIAEDVDYAAVVLDWLGGRRRRERVRVPEPVERTSPSTSSALDKPANGAAERRSGVCSTSCATAPRRPSST